MPSGNNSLVSSKPKLVWKSIPDVWTLLRPQWTIMAAGFGLMVANRATGLVLPATTKYFLDDVILKKHVQILPALVLAVLTATAVEATTSYLLAQLMSKSSQRLIMDLRIKVQAHVGRLPLSFYDGNKTGVLVSRIMNDIEGVRSLVGTGIIDICGGVTTALFALIYLLHANPLMTVMVAIGLAAFGTGLSRFFKFLRPLYRSRNDFRAEVIGRLTESIAGVRVVKGYRAEQHEEEVFASGSRLIFENTCRSITATSLMGISSTVLSGVLSASVMLVGAHQILAGKMTAGGFVAYTIFLSMLVGPVRYLATIGSQITEALAAMDRTREILSETPEDPDPARTIYLSRLEGRIDFENLSFSYNTGRMVLNEITFTAEPGTLTALVGPSGAGKSTTIGLIAAFYVPTIGRVLVDGADLSKVDLDSFRTQLGIVLQESFLFDGSIRDNVAFGRPTASEAEILAACRVARVDEFAEAMEKQYDTFIGERGVKLSGGQKQRVSIARAILADPRILILDEATSSLDSESEALIQEGLSYLMKGRTTIVIAHRLSTIRSADQILVYEAGRIIERGNHESLYASRGRYYDLYTKQHGLEANLFLATGEVASEFA